MCVCVCVCVCVCLIKKTEHSRWSGREELTCKITVINRQLILQYSAVYSRYWYSSSQGLRPNSEAASQFRVYFLQRLHLKAGCLTVVRLDCPISKLLHMCPSFSRQRRIQLADPSPANISRGSLRAGEDSRTWRRQQRSEWQLRSTL